jgi:ABC-type Fe3+-hydroxamate transport system substrate-binding protein
MLVYTDQIANKITLNNIPNRIISLVPSQTELLFDLGLEKSIVGITKFCVHPKDKVKGKTIIGGTKSFRFEVIDDLQPDLIIGNKEENTPIGIKTLMQDYPVWISDIETLEDNYAMISDFGKIFDKKENAEKLIFDIKISFEKLNDISYSKPKVLYLIWQNPYMSVGNDTFIHQMLEMDGFENVTKNFKRYPELTLEQINAMEIDYIFLSSEPYPFTVKHVQDLGDKTKVEKIELVDGEMFSWYGSRVLKSANYIVELRKKLGL